MSDTTLTKEFCIARDLFNFQLHDFREVTIIAMKAAFLPHLERKEMIKNIANEMESKFGILPEYKEHRNAI
jgi:adenosine deaminase